MQRIPTLVLLICMITAFGFSVFYGIRVYQGHQELVMEQKLPGDDPYRIVMISEEMGSSFWNELKLGAQREAEKNGALIDFWGSYRPNTEEVLKYMDIAIASDVDGIIVQGIENSSFNELVNIKAASKGISVITVGTDAPLALRKTFVGSNHWEEGYKIASMAARQLNGVGKVGIVKGQPVSSATKLRLEGMIEALSKYPMIEQIEADHYAPPLTEIEHLLNVYPDCRAFIGLNASAGSQMVKTISQRARIQDYHLFLFDNNPQTVKWVEEGMIDATLDHDPASMGELSVQLTLQWLEGRQIPLEDNYFTDVLVLGGDDPR